MLTFLFKEGDSKENSINALINIIKLHDNAFVISLARANFSVSFVRNSFHRAISIRINKPWITLVKGYYAERVLKHQTQKRTDELRVTINDGRQI